MFKIMYVTQVKYFIAVKCNSLREYGWLFLGYNLSICYNLSYFMVKCVMLSKEPVKQAYT